MYTLLDAELGNEDVEGSIKNANHLSWPYNWTIALGQIRNQHTKVQVRRLLLSELGRVLLTVLEMRLGSDHSKGRLLTCCIVAQFWQPNHDPL